MKKQVTITLLILLSLVTLTGCFGGEEEVVEVDVTVEDPISVVGADGPIKTVEDMKKERAQLIQEDLDNPEKELSENDPHAE